MQENDAPRRSNRAYLNARSRARLPPAAGPDTGVDVSDERRQHHRRDEEDGYPQQSYIDNVAQIVNDGGALARRASIDSAKSRRTSAMD